MMKMVINSSALQNIIREAVEDEILRRRVRGIVSESVYSHVQSLNEEKDDETDSDDSNASDKDWFGYKNQSDLEKAVVGMLKDKKIDMAPIWEEVLDCDSDTARSWGSKILAGKRPWPNAKCLREVYKILRTYNSF